MTKKNNEANYLERLRKLAVEKLSTTSPQALSANENEDLLHELRVHQIELEMQNEELKLSQWELELSREKYFKLYDLAPVGYCTLSEKGLIIESNLKACELFGVNRTYLKKQMFSSFIFKDNQDIYYQAVKNLSQTGNSQTCELRIISKNGTTLWVLLDISYTQNTDDAILYLVVVSDITERKQAEIEKEERERLANILEGTNVGNWEWNVQTGQTVFNERWAQIIGYTLEEISPVSIKTWERFIHPEDLAKSNEQLARVFNRKLEYYDIESRMKHKDGSWVWVQDRGKVISWSSDWKPLLMAGTHTNITNRKKSEEAIIHLSYHYMLTGLFNRRFFEEEIKRLDTDRQLPLSIIMGDLNSLKLTNDTFGHQEGDRLLIETAKLLKTVCRSDDILARWGGDEFVILLPKTSIASTVEIMQRIKKECSELFIQKMSIGLAIGIATKIDSGQNIQDIIVEAESNMYKNKLAGKQSSAGSVIAALEQALYEKSNETMAHTQRLKELSLKLGKKLKLHPHQLDELSLLASLHDIGKVAVPETILLKEGALSENECEVMRRHPTTGFNIAQSSPQIAHIAKYILSCHENWDGSGYPEGLAKEEIPLLSRIVAITDSYDVMTGNRSYKCAISKEDAVKELKKYAGIQFDPVLVEKFIEVLAE